MTTFLTLMRREWMQHRIGWLLVMLAPTVLLLALGLMDGGIEVDFDSDRIKLPPFAQAPALLQTGFLVLAVTGGTLALALLSLGFQAPGLAWRDQQDRSIEFWNSLPVSHAKAVGAMLVAQALLMPMLAIAVGLAGGLLASAVAIVTTHGPMAWLGLPWGQLALVTGLLLLRMAVALVVAMAWLSPLLLLTMAASAWLRRWGLPVVAALSLAGTLILDKRLPEPLVGPALWRPTSEALHALLYFNGVRALEVHSVQDAIEQLPQLPLSLLADLPPMLGALATPAFVLALAGAALGFALLVWRRQRGA